MTEKMFLESNMNSPVERVHYMLSKVNETKTNFMTSLIKSVNKIFFIELLTEKTQVTYKGSAG